jgi:hypothetical protein
MPRNRTDTYSKMKVSELRAECEVRQMSCSKRVPDKKYFSKIVNLKKDELIAALRLYDAEYGL